MSVTMKQAIDALKDGRQHWRDVVSGKVPPKLPRKYRFNKSLRRWFACGAVEEKETMETDD